MPALLTMPVTVDITGSSRQFAIGIPLIAERTFTFLEQKVAGVTVFVWTHGDEDCGQMPTLVLDKATPQQAIAAVKNLTYDGGGDPPEDHAAAIQNLLNLTPWGATSRDRNILLMFATAETKPLKSGQSMKDLGKAIKARGVFLFAVCETTPLLHELVQSAEGILIPISNTPDEREIQRVVAQLGASIAATVSSGTIAMAQP
jgi:hypothetical protein